MVLLPGFRVLTIVGAKTETPWTVMLSRQKMRVMSKVDIEKIPRLTPCASILSMIESWPAFSALIRSAAELFLRTRANEPFRVDQ